MLLGFIKGLKKTQPETPVGANYYNLVF